MDSIKQLLIQAKVQFSDCMHIALRNHNKTLREGLNGMHQTHSPEKGLNKELEHVTAVTTSLS